MISKNICKFIPVSSPDILEIKCFIYESNAEVMKTEFILASNRMILVRQGSCKMFFDGKELDVVAGNLVFGFEGEKFHVEQNKKCEYMYIEFGGTRSDALFRRFGINSVNRLFFNFDGIIPLWIDSLSRASEINIDLAAESMLFYAFSRITGITAEKNKLLSEIIEITEMHFTNPELNIGILAEELSYNSKYISHFFKDKMGMGYTEYVRNLRIKYAVSLFDHGIDSVKNVALLSGFSDPLYFSTVFKKIMGISPKEYMLRKQG